MSTHKVIYKRKKNLVNITEFGESERSEKKNF